MSVNNTLQSMLPNLNENVKGDNTPISDAPTTSPTFDATETSNKDNTDLQQFQFDETDNETAMSGNHSSGYDNDINLSVIKNEPSTTIPFAKTRGISPHDESTNLIASQNIASTSNPPTTTASFRAHGNAHDADFTGIRPGGTAAAFARSSHTGQTDDITDTIITSNFFDTADIKQDENISATTESRNSFQNTNTAPPPHSQSDTTNTNVLAPPNTPNSHSQHTQNTNQFPRITASTTTNNPLVHAASGHNNTNIFVHQDGIRAPANSSNQNNTMANDNNNEHILHTTPKPTYIPCPTQQIPDIPRPTPQPSSKHTHSVNGFIYLMTESSTTQKQYFMYSEIVYIVLIYTNKWVSC